LANREELAARLQQAAQQAQPSPEQEEMAIAEAESSINEQNNNNPLMIDFYNALAEGQNNVSSEDQYPI